MPATRSPRRQPPSAAAPAMRTATSGASCGRAVTARPSPIATTSARPVVSAPLGRAKRVHRHRQPEHDCLVFPQRLADGAPQPRAEPERCRQHERTSGGQVLSSAEEREHNRKCGQQRGRDGGQERRAERRPDVHQAETGCRPEDGRGDDGGHGRVGRAISSVVREHEPGPLEQQRGRADRVVERQRAVHEQFPRGELRRLRVEAADLAAVRVVDEQRAGEDRDGPHPVTRHGRVPRPS